MIRKVLATKNPNDFANRRVRVSFSNGCYRAVQTGEEMNFADMDRLRGEGAYAEVIQHDLCREGHDFTNLGLSVALTTTLNDSTYAVLVKQDRADAVVAKLLSGYIDSRHFLSPMDTMDAEVAEEFLPCSADGRILAGMRNLRQLPRPFDSSYDHFAAYQLIEADLLRFPGLTTERISVEDHSKAKLYFSAPTNSAQMVFPYHIDIPRVPSDGEEINYLVHTESTLNHAEDVFVPEDGILEIRLHERGLLLVELDNGGLTDRVYTFERGSLRKHDSDLVLSEAFAPKSDGIVAAENIPLKEYLESRSRGA